MIQRRGWTSRGSAPRYEFSWRRSLLATLIGLALFTLLRVGIQLLAMVTIINGASG
ncbi:hypothetical protein Msil_3889 [Methylocella silvestris BL2]|uniref:Uncharacterized protein n=1 Tax=Methylocella silvestris (strain DSM 15510 / CIP 108128 / LMG 27833 / NCIMB 13906 / BL2) TaxID=395965 RepID=B8EMU1_METSB|nr:hypothetical protein Msil_3889 [Methylocella silvestris BL2]